MDLETISLKIQASRTSIQNQIPIKTSTCFYLVYALAATHNVQRLHRMG